MLEKPLTAEKRGLSKEEKRELDEKADASDETVRDVTAEEQAMFRAMFPGNRPSGNEG